jgi:hypothetical protein
MFLVAVIDSTENSGTADEMVAIDAFNERLQRDGQFVLALGLHAPETASVIDNRGDEPIVTPGSLFTGVEHYSGMWIIDVADDATAERLARDASRACNRRVEIRRFHWN